jgi:hypothetical protein
MLATLLAGMLTIGLGMSHPPVPSWLPGDFELGNYTAPVEYRRVPVELPRVVTPFTEHVRGLVPTIRMEESDAALGLTLDAVGMPQLVTTFPGFEDGTLLRATATRGAETWYGTEKGLYRRETADSPALRHEYYGVHGPLSTQITALVVDAENTLWVGTPLGLSLLNALGNWRSIQGREGLPVEDVKALALGEAGSIWIGTSRGAILYTPQATGRQWFYRAGPRYLPDDMVRAIAVAPGGTPAYFLTNDGVGRIDTRTTTLLEKAETIERRLNERHRRLGMVASCELDDALNPTSWQIGDNDNDGLWTAYHVAAMSLAYGATKDPAALASARESMHALYMLQNVSGIPGLPARSVVPAAIGIRKSEQWRPTADGTMYWKSDTSSDEIDGHYLAFYSYFEHIAQYDPEEKALAQKQIRAMTDYIVEHNYQLIDWNGERTRWGFWNPEALNSAPRNYEENGLNSLQLLSFLKVAHFITGDAKYDEHYRKLILEHDYLTNTLLTKKLFPDENNHSDDQLGFVAWYPILQLEKDPRVREALHRGVYRHYQVVEPEQPSFFTFVFATIDRRNADIEGAIENLRQIPTDRRTWKMINSRRDDVAFDPRTNRFGRPVLDLVLPADERNFEKWNADPYVPDGGGKGREEDDGAAYLLPYWMGRYHGFIAEP